MTWPTGEMTDIVARIMSIEERMILEDARQILENVRMDV